MEQALRWVNNPGVDDRGVGERGEDDETVFGFKNKYGDLPCPPGSGKWRQCESVCADILDSSEKSRDAERRPRMARF